MEDMCNDVLTSVIRQTVLMEKPKAAEVVVRCRHIMLLYCIVVLVGAAM